MSRRLALSLALASLALAACGPVKNLDPLAGLAGPQDNSRYNFEVSDQGWAKSASQGGSVERVFQAPGQSFFGQGSLAVNVLSLGNDNASSARASVLFASGFPNLAGKTVRLFLYAPADVAPSDDKPTGASIFLVDHSLGANYSNGRSFNLARGNWTEISYAPVANSSASPLTSTSGLYVAAGFDPSSIQELGIKVGTSGSASGFSYSGILLIDGVDW